jgi:hypothetical protein
LGYRHPKILFIATPYSRRKTMKRKSSLTIGALLLLTMTTLPLQGNAEEKESEHLRSSEDICPPRFTPQDFLY